MNNATPLSAADVVALTGGNCRNNDGGWGNSFGGDWIALIILFLFASMFGWGGNGFGGFGGFGGGNALTRAELYDGFALQNIDSAVRGVQQGICDSTYALNNSITGGFAQAELSRCNQQAALMMQLNNMAADAAKCCCETQRALERGFSDTNYNMATQACDTRNTIQNATRDIIDATNANYRGLMDFMVQEKLSSKDMLIAQLQNQVSQSQQNAVLMAAMDANKAEILRRTGAECPTAAYLVQPPTPVNFPLNGCGQVQFNNGYGCGFGCN